MDEPIVVEKIQDGSVELVGNIILESKDETKSFFESNGFIKGKVPVVNINQYTKNGNKYTENCVSNLDLEIAKYLGGTKNEQFMWPPLAMYPTHNPAIGGESKDRLLSVCGKITGTFREGNFWGVNFETLKTNAGKDVAELLINNMIEGVSLRGIGADKKKNDKGGDDVDRLLLQGFGVDFTNIPAMPGVAGGIKLEDKNNGGDEKMTLEELKEKHPDLWKEIQDKISKGQTLESALSDANTKITKMESDLRESRKILAQRAIDSVVNKFKLTLESEKSFTEKSVTKLVDGAKVFVREKADTILADRKEIDPLSTDYEDALSKSVSSQLESRVDELKSMIADYVKKETFGDPPDTGKAKVADDGNGGVNKLNINAMDSRTLLIESENEMVGLPTGKRDAKGEAVPPPLKDAIMAKAWGIPMYEDGQHIMAKYMPSKLYAAHEVIENYLTEPALIRNGSFSLNDTDLYADPKQNKIITSLRNRQKLEANELTSSGVIGTLFPDIRNGIIESAFALSKWLTYANVTTTQSDTYQIWEEDYKRVGERQFGVCSNFAASGTFATTGDDGALPYPDRVYAKITTVNGATDVTLTLNGTNQNGVATTGTVTIPAAAAVGTFWEIRPATIGDRFIDLLATGSASGGTSGACDLMAFVQVDSGTELTFSGNASVSLVRRQGSVAELDLRVDLGWRMMEDAMKSLAMHGPGRYDAAAALVRAISLDIANQVDRRGFGGLNLSTNYDSSNDISFDVSTSGVPAGYTSEEWKSKLHEKLVNLNEKITDWGDERPTRIAINDSDVHKLLWMKGDFISRFQNRAEAFFSGMAWGIVAGMTVVDCRFQPHGRFVAGNPSRISHFVYIPLEFRGPYSMVNDNKSDTFVARQRSGDVFTKPRTRGRLLITE